METPNKTEFIFDEYYQHPKLMEKPIVLYPAGGQGIKALRFLRKRGIEPVAFCDAAEEKIGTCIGNLLVESLETLIERYGKGGVKYIVNSKFHFAEIYAQLCFVKIPEEDIVPPGIKNYCDNGIIDRPLIISDRMLCKLQNSLLDLMIFFHNVCEKYDIPYFLYGGTLLGAVRHKGFIPWDDDVDIVMYRKDYSRFYKVVKKELGDKYVIDYRAHRKSIALKNSVYRKFKTSLSFAIQIDTFPLDNVFPAPSGLTETQEKIQIRFIKMASKYKWRKGDGSRFWYIGWLAAGLAQCFARMLNVIDTGYVCYLCGVRGWREKRTFSRMLFNKENRILLEFCGRSFYAPQRYDEILRQMYGDYMQLPPPHMRVAAHALEELIFDTTKECDYSD